MSINYHRNRLFFRRTSIFLFLILSKFVQTEDIQINTDLFQVNWRQLEDPIEILNLNWIDGKGFENNFFYFPQIIPFFLDIYDFVCFYFISYIQSERKVKQDSCAFSNSFRVVILFWSMLYLLLLRFNISKVGISIRWNPSSDYMEFCIIHNYLREGNLLISDISFKMLSCPFPPELFSNGTDV